MIIHNYLNELWMDIPGVRGAQISSYGRVKRLAFSTTSIRKGTEITFTYPEIMLKPTATKTGYLFVRLVVTETGKQKAFYVHRLVAQVFIPNPDDLPEVNHINEDKYDNRVENLEWCTHSYNMNYGTRMDRARQTQIESGNWQDYSGFSDEEKKEYRKKQMKEWEEKNKEHIKKRHREYYENNKEQYAERQNKWRKNNKEKVKTIRRKTYENNREHYLDYQKEYRKQHYQKKLDHTVYVYNLVNRYELVGVYDNYSTAADFIGVSSSTIKNRIDNNSLKQVKNYVVSKETLN